MEAKRTVRLDNLRLCKQAGAYVDALHAVATGAGWIGLSKPELSGMTVAGFRFAVNRRLTAESATAYNWMAENFLAADFIGLTSSQQAGFTFHPTFPLYRKHALAAIRGSITRGIGAIFWHDGFAVATGYDEAKGLLYYSGGEEKDDRAASDRTIACEDFGSGADPYWYYQTLHGRIALDEAAVRRESLIQAVYKWETHDSILPREQYACAGRLTTRSLRLFVQAITIRKGHDEQSRLMPLPNGTSRFTSPDYKKSCPSPARRLQTATNKRRSCSRKRTASCRRTGRAGMRADCDLPGFLPKRSRRKIGQSGRSANC